MIHIYTNKKSFLGRDKRDKLNRVVKVMYGLQNLLHFQPEMTSHI